MSRLTILKLGMEKEHRIPLVRISGSTLLTTLSEVEGMYDG
jgi:hypothetical protein